jgi:hypothetical protein
LSKDFNSNGFSVNIDGELTAAVGDSESVMEQVKELFDLAEEALDLQVERAQSDTALSGRDEEQPRHTNHKNGQPSVSNGNVAQPTPVRTQNGNGQQPVPHQDEQPATNKQINYLLNIGKRLKLSTVQLEKKVASILGRPVGLYDLTKQAAAVVIDKLTNGAANGKSTSRY